jgi:rRNA-processing protein FCF1
MKGTATDGRVRVGPQTPWSNVGFETLARRHGITAYDAAYMDLAWRANLPLATSDGPLAQAALSEGIVVLGGKS